MKMLFWLGALGVLAAGCSTGTRREPPPEIDAGTDAGPLPEFDAGPPDTGPMCTLEEMLCGSECVLTNQDESNCGGCGLRCPPDVGCVGGFCACLAPMTACGDACVDTVTDPAHCGACDTPCAEGLMCRDGACIVACDEPSIICLNAGVSVCADLQ